MSRGRRYLWSVPWVLALVGLAIPMIGSGFIGWPFVMGWFAAVLLIWWVRPLGDVSRAVRLVTGVLSIGLLALLSTLGGLYLVPAVLAWMVLAASERSPEPATAAPVG